MKIKSLLLFALLASHLQAQTILDSAGLSALASSTTNFIPLFASTTGGSTRDDFTGFVGYGFTANTNLSVCSLGMLVLTGNSLSHTIYLYQCADGTYGSGTLLASAVVNTSGKAANEWAYTSITAQHLSSGNYYVILMSVTASDGDNWLNFNQTYSLDFPADVAIYAPSYSTSLPAFNTTIGGGPGYADPSFLYTKP